jgi:hypothetical protein
MPWYVGVVWLLAVAAFALLLTMPLWDRLRRRINDDLDRVEAASEPTGDDRYITD